MLAGLRVKWKAWSQPVKQQRRSAKQRSFPLSGKHKTLGFARTVHPFFTRICTGLALCVIIDIINAHCICERIKASNRSSMEMAGLLKKRKKVKNMVTYNSQNRV